MSQQVRLSAWMRYDILTFDIYIFFNLTCTVKDDVTHLIILNQRLMQQQTLPARHKNPELLHSLVLTTLLCGRMRSDGERGRAPTKGQSHAFALRVRAVALKKKKNCNELLKLRLGGPWGAGVDLGPAPDVTRAHK